MTVCFYAPSVAGTGIYVVWRLIFSSDSYGMINGLLMRMGLIDEPILWLTDPQMSLGIVILVHIWLSLGAGFLAFIAGLQNIDRSQYEAGAIDGIRQPVDGAVVHHPAQHAAHADIRRGDADRQVVCRGGRQHGAGGFPSIKYAAHTIDIHAFDYGFVRFEMGYACAVRWCCSPSSSRPNQVITRALKKVGS